MCLLEPGDRDGAETALRSPEYEADKDVRRVRHNGEIRWGGEKIYINQALAGEPVGLSEIEAGWSVSYGPVLLGIIDPKAQRLKPPKRARRGLVDNAARCPQGPQQEQQQTKQE